MMIKRLSIALNLLAISLLWGCGGLTPSPSLLALPLLPATAEDLPRLATVSHELDTRALACVPSLNCDQIHFARALVSLFENQEAARASFRRLIEDNPASRLTFPSQRWLELIEQGTGMTEQERLWIPIAAQLVRDWLDRQFTEYQHESKAAVVVNPEPLIADQPRRVQVLEKQVRERDRRIAILQSQLEALKLIDLDREQGQRAVKIPATLVPLMDTPR